MLTWESPALPGTDPVKVQVYGVPTTIVPPRSHVEVAQLWPPTSSLSNSPNRSSTSPVNSTPSPDGEVLVTVTVYVTVPPGSFTLTGLADLSTLIDPATSATVTVAVPVS